MKKRAIKGKRIIGEICMKLSILVLTACITVIFICSCITIQTKSNTYRYMIPQTQKNQTKFENSKIFSDLLKDNINSLTRMCVIKNQLETAGRYDSKKIVDITSYANRTEVVIDDKVTAKFYLDDLIKWGNYGLDFESVSGSMDELDDYFYRIKDEVANKPYESKLKVVENANYEIEEHNSGAIENGTMDILIPRYKTIEGKDLIEYANNREEYETLIHNLDVACKNLFQNYTEYTTYHKLFAEGNTNLIYCYQMVNGNKIIRYSNMDKDDYSVDEMTSIFASKDKFLYYNPDKMQINTNTAIDAQFMRSTIGTYEYSFADNSRVWIALDNTYAANDSLKKAKDAYDEKTPYYNILLTVAVVSLVIHLLSVLFFGMQERKWAKTITDRKELKLIDRFPLELYLVFMIGFVVFSFWIADALVHALIHAMFSGTTLVAMNCTFVLLLSIVIPSFVFSIIRRVCSGYFFKNTILYVLCKKIRQGFIEAYDHGHLVARTWLPYLIFLCLNLVLVLLGIYGILIAFIFDMGVGYYLYRENKERQNIVGGIENIKNGDFNYQLSTQYVHGDNLALANAVNSIGKGIQKAVETSMKDERLKADLITNVSHDIKTPLTSIINYVDLIKREEISNEKIQSYVDVLDKKSQRLKQLTDDLVEASKITSGNISLTFEKINFKELVNQSLGEFSEKFEEKHLQIVTSLPDNPVYIMADSRRIYRVIENLYNNIYKYALTGTRVYVGMIEKGEKEKTVTLSIKNISAQPLNIQADELTERFIRGDVSRGTEGSGLGLSIAKNLTQALKGNFEIVLDGDLFKVMITFKEIEN